MSRLITIVTLAALSSVSAMAITVPVSLPDAGSTGLMLIAACAGVIGVKALAKRK